MFIEEDLQSYKRKLEEDVEETTSERFRKLKRLQEEAQRLETRLKEDYGDKLFDIKDFKDSVRWELEELREGVDQ